MNAAEFQAALPEPRSIMGLRLLPLSIGRFQLLKRFESAFVSDESISIADIKDAAKELYFAMIVCGFPVAEFKKRMDEGTLGDECKRFGKHSQKYIKRTKDFNIIHLFGEFQEYITESTKVPWVVLPVNQSTASSPAHWVSGVEMTLRSKIGWTKQEIEEEPMQKALADFFKYLESQGAVKLVSQEEYAELEKLGKENADAFEKMMEQFSQN